MTHVKAFVVLAIIAFISLSNGLWGQEAPGKKYPSAVLVQLKAEQNRTNALIKARKYNELEIFRKDVQGVMIATINDFWNHFDYCPVYYYIDTNFEAVMARKFDGILLDEHLSPITGTVISDTSTDYFIVYYGYPTWQTRKRYWDTTRAADQGGHPNGRGLIINDYKMRQLNYIYRLDFDFFNFKKNRNRNPYKYTSKKFDVEYYPFASEFNRKLGASRKKNNKIQHDEDIIVPFIFMPSIK